MLLYDMMVVAYDRSVLFLAALHAAFRMFSLYFETAEVHTGDTERRTNDGPRNRGEGLILHHDKVSKKQLCGRN